MPYEPIPKKVKTWQPLAFSVVLIIGILLGMRLQHQMPMFSTPTITKTTTKGEHPEKIEEIIRYIEAKYVDEIDREALIQKVVEEIIEELDPHSVYLSKEQVQISNEALNGNFEGIGIEFLVIEDTIVVMTPIKDGPSEKAGLLAGDKIVAIEDSVIVGGSLDEAKIVEQLRGEKGSSVKIGILRKGNPDILYFDIIRDNIPIHSVDAAYMLTDDIGYIKVNRFSSTTHTEFLDQLEMLVDKKALKHLVIDLRDNPGGYLQEATSILNQFFKKKDKLLVYTEGRNVVKSEYETTGRNFFPIENIAVLIDENSASASEIMAGAIQDWDRGIIIGRRSFGKGLVQEQYNLTDGSAIRLTVARYYTPSGRSIQKDYKDRKEYDADILNRYQRGELYNSNQLVILDTLPFYTNEGRVVYGGGGIIPDIFVPLDSVKMSAYFTQIQPYIRTYTFQYYHQQKEKLQYESIHEFLSNYQVSEKMYEDFQNHVKQQAPEIVITTSPRLNELSKLYLKARLAKHLFKDEGLYTVLNSEDKVVRRAIQVLDMKNPLSVLE